MGGALVLIIFALICGFVIGMKTLLWVQLLLPIALVILVKHSDGKGVGSELAGCILMVILCIGTLMGDLMYYTNFYQGDFTFTKAFLWLFQP